MADCMMKYGIKLNPDQFQTDYENECHVDFM